MKVKKFVGFSLKLHRCGNPALSPAYGQCTDDNFSCTCVILMRERAERGGRGRERERACRAQVQNLLCTGLTMECRDVMSKWELTNTYHGWCENNWGCSYTYHGKERERACRTFCIINFYYSTGTKVNMYRTYNGMQRCYKHSKWGLTYTYHGYCDGGVITHHGREREREIVEHSVLYMINRLLLQHRYEYRTYNGMQRCHENNWGCNYTYHGRERERL